MVTKNYALVSVIVPVFNRRSVIGRTLNSCLSQRYPHIEVIVVDDGSTDGTGGVVKSFKDRFESSSKSLLYLAQENLGACSARNLGMAHASGDYIQFLDSDDVLEPCKISDQISSLENSEDSFALCDFAYVDSNGRTLKKVTNDGDIFTYMKRFKSVSIMAPLLRKSSIIKGLQWNTELERNQDMDFMFKYFLTVTTWAYVPGCYCKYYMHGGDQISDSYSKGIQYFALVKSMCAFYSANKHLIPLRNRSLVPRYVLRLALMFLKSRFKKIFSFGLPSGKEWF
ncbi:glycosyltransferase family A protein [Desulfobaculum senezii]